MLENVIVLPKCLWITYRVGNKTITEEVEVTTAVYDIEGCKSISYIDSERKHQTWYRENKNIEFFETMKEAIDSAPGGECIIKYLYSEIYYD